MRELSAEGAAQSRFERPAVKHPALPEVIDIQAAIPQ